MFPFSPSPQSAIFLTTEAEAGTEARATCWVEYPWEGSGGRRGHTPSLDRIGMGGPC